MPGIARWPGKIAPHGASDLPWAFWDFLPTAAELAGVQSPRGIDGISIVPTLLGKGRQKKHDFMYWEFHEGGGSRQAVRMGPWKAVCKWQAPIRLYDLRNDLPEAHDVAAEHPDVVAKIDAYLAGARTDSQHWPLRQ